MGKNALKPHTNTPPDAAATADSGSMIIQFVKGTDDTDY